KTGTGNCVSGSEDAWSNSSGASITGGLVQLSQPVSYATPAAPANPGTVDFALSKNGCDHGGPPGCTAAAATGAYLAGATLVPGNYQDVTMGGGGTLHLSAGTYIFNSLALKGGARLAVVRRDHRRHERQRWRRCAPLRSPPCQLIRHPR